MKNKLLVTTALVAFVSASNVFAAEHINVDPAAEYNDSSYSNVKYGAEGGAFINYKNLTFLNDVTFEGNEAKSGGAIYNHNNEYQNTVTLKKSAKFNGNKATNIGGAIVNAAVFNIDGEASFDENTAENEGGAVYNTKDANLTFKDKATFNNNTSGSFGGAIYNDGNIQFDQTASFTENHNKKYLGGTVMNDVNGNISFAKDAIFEGNYSETGSAGALDNEGTITFKGKTEFNHNRAASNGGAIYNWATGKIDFAEQTSFKNNIAKKSGGAIYNKGDLTVKGEFAENIAQNGGAIYNASKLTVADGTTFRNNLGADSGSAIANYGESLTIGDNVEFIGNTAFVKDFNDKTNSDVEYGDGVSKGSEMGTLYSEGTSSRTNKITIGNNVKFSGNTALGGAGMYLFGANDVTIGDNACFMNNIAKQGDADGTPNGGAITLVSNSNNGTPKLNIGKNAQFIGNKSENGYAGAINVNAKNAELSISNGAVFSDNTASKTAGGAIYNNGKLTLGTASFSNNKHGDQLNDIRNDNTLIVNGDLTLDGGISGTSGTTTFEDGSSLTVNAGTTTISNSVVNKGATLNLKFDNGFDGDYQLITGSLDKEFEIAKNNLYNIKSTENGKYDVSKKNSSEIAASTGANANQASTIFAVTSGNTNNATFNAAAKNINALLQSSNAADVKAGLEAATVLAPEVAPIVQTTATETVNQVFGAVSARLSGGSVASATEGKSSGDGVFDRAAMWVQGLFNKSKLDDTSKAKGFDADTHGVAFGFEKKLDNDVKAGIGYAYSKTDIDGFMRDTDVDTHTVMAYGEYKPSNWFVNGIASYGWSKYEESKNVAGVGIGAKYDVNTYALQAMTGYDMDVNGYLVTPEAGLRYTHVEQDSYTDTAGQHVKTDDADTLTGIVGAKVAKSWELDNGTTITPEVRVAATYDLMNDDTNAVVALANGSSYAVKGKALDRFGMEFGAGVTAELNDKIEVSVGYEGKFRDNYQDHTGLINAKYKF